MPFIQSLGTKLNNLRHIGGKVLGAAAKIGVKVGGYAAMAAPMISVENPVAGRIIGNVGRIVAGLGHAAGNIKSGAADGRLIAGGINDLKAMRTVA